VIWSDGASTYTQWAVAARLGRAEIVDDGANVATAVHSATGISSGTAYTVPAMLLPVSVGPAGHGRRGEMTLDGIENVDGHSCARVIEPLRSTPGSRPAPSAPLVE